MITRLLLLLALLGGVAAVAADRERSKSSSKKAAPAPVTGVTFDAFRSIGERNIFDANRRGRSRSSDDAPPRSDVITFVGTLDSEKGVLAFFDSSDLKYRKALRVGQSVEQFKVTKISADNVELERDGKPLTMRMSQQFRRPPGGEWKLIGADIVRAEAQANAAAEAARATAASAPPAIPADASETLRRLMEKRQKELKQ